MALQPPPSTSPGPSSSTSAQAAQDEMDLMADASANIPGLGQTTTPMDADAARVEDDGGEGHDAGGDDDEAFLEISAAMAAATAATGPEELQRRDRLEAAAQMRASFNLPGALETAAEIGREYHRTDTEYRVARIREVLTELARVLTSEDSMTATPAVQVSKAGQVVTRVFVLEFVGFGRLGFVEMRWVWLWGLGSGLS